MSDILLEIENLHAGIEGREILRGVDLRIRRGEVHAIMGPNGAGKSTLSAVLAGRPDYRVSAGSVRYDGRDLLAMAPEERSWAGIFLSFQYPVEIPGVSITNFMKAALNARRKAAGLPELTPAEYLKLLSRDAVRPPGFYCFFQTGFFTESEHPLKDSAEQNIEFLLCTGNHFRSSGGSGGMGKVNHIAGSQKIFLPEAQHTLDIRFIISIIRKRNLTGKISIGSDVPEAVFFSVLGIFVFPDDLHQGFITDFPGMQTCLFHPVKGLKPAGNIFTYHICAHRVPPEIILFRASLKNPQKFSINGSEYSSES